MNLRAWVLIIALFFAAMAKAEIPASCQGTDLSSLMYAGQASDAAPDKIYNFVKIRERVMSSLNDEKPNNCFGDFYRQALKEEGEYWGAKLARDGCQVSDDGQISGGCPDASEAKKSTEFIGSLDRELKAKVRDRVDQSRVARVEASGRASIENRCPLKGAGQTLAEFQNQMCCGTANDSGGVIRAVEKGISYPACIGKTQPTKQEILSASGIGDCLGQALKAAVETMWGALSSIFKLPGELFAARSQLWALVTNSSARAKFASALMSQFTHFFTDRVHAMGCYNSYEKVQFVCRMSGQLIAACAAPETMGAFLGLASKPLGAASEVLAAMLAKTEKGSAILKGLKAANQAAEKGLAAVGRTSSRVGEKIDEATAGYAGKALRGTEKVTETLDKGRRLIGRPISALAEKAATKIERSASFQKLLSAGFRAGKKTSAVEKAEAALKGDGTGEKVAANDNSHDLANDNTHESANENSSGDSSEKPPSKLKATVDRGIAKTKAAVQSTKTVVSDAANTIKSKISSNFQWPSAKTLPESTERFSYYGGGETATNARYSDLGLKVNKDMSLSASDRPTALSKAVEDFKKNYGATVEAQVWGGSRTDFGMTKEGKIIARPGQNFMRDPAQAIQDIKAAQLRIDEINQLKAQGLALDDPSFYVGQKEGARTAILEGQKDGPPLSRTIYNLANRDKNKVRVVISDATTAANNGALGLASEGYQITLKQSILKDPDLAQAVLLHEIKHTTSVNKEMPDRLIWMKSADSAIPVWGYEKYMRMDELEARLPEMASYRMNPSMAPKEAYTLKQIRSIISTQRNMLTNAQSVLNAPAGQGLSMQSTDEAILNVPIGTTDKMANVTFPIKAGSPLTAAEQVRDLVNQRLDFLNKIQTRLDKRYPASP